MSSDAKAWLTMCVLVIAVVTTSIVLGHRETLQREELRQRSFQVCIQAGRSADECKRGLP